MHPADRTFMKLPITFWSSIIRTWWKHRYDRCKSSTYISFHANRQHEGSSSQRVYSIHTYVKFMVVRKRSRDLATKLHEPLAVLAFNTTRCFGRVTFGRAEACALAKSEVTLGIPIVLPLLFVTHTRLAECASLCFVPGLTTAPLGTRSPSSGNNLYCNANARVGVAECCVN